MRYVIPERFFADDHVTVLDGGMQWAVVERDFWHTDTQPAYKLIQRYRRRVDQKVRFRYAYQSELRLAE
jgi:uncharacterized protein YeaO (DUF488 family)